MSYLPGLHRCAWCNADLGPDNGDGTTREVLRSVTMRYELIARERVRLVEGRRRKEDGFSLNTEQGVIMPTEKTVNCEMRAPKRTWLQRLFPARALIVDSEREGFAPGYLAVETDVVFDWKDRLRLLLSGKLRVTTKTFTDAPVERAESESVAYALPPNTHVPKPTPAEPVQRMLPLRQVIEKFRPEDVTILEVPEGPDRWEVLVSDTDERWEVRLADTPVVGCALRLRNLAGDEETFTVAHVQGQMIVVHRETPVVATDDPRSVVTLSVEVGTVFSLHRYPIEFAARDVPQEVPDPSKHPTSYKRDVEGTVGNGLVRVRVLGLWRAASAEFDRPLIADKIEVLGFNVEVSERLREFFRAQLSKA